MIIVDSHTHFHGIFKLNAILDAAYRNLRRIAQNFALEEHFSAVLFVAGIGSDDIKSRLEDATNREWLISTTGELNTLSAQSLDRRKICLIIGRQALSEEGLEVLGYSPTYLVDSGLPIKKIIVDIRASGGIAIIPWGFGKWIGKRKKVMIDLIKTWDDIFFIGDNGGRPKFLSYPYVFQLAEKKGIRVLPGSDPLPIPNEFNRIGSCGFSIEGKLDENAPLSQIVDKLKNPSIKMKPFASYIKPINFIFVQLHLKWSKLKT